MYLSVYFKTVLVPKIPFPPPENIPITPFPAAAKPYLAKTCY